MDRPATQLARALAERAEDVCRRYLSKGRREGRYWLVGDIQNTPGRSLYVRLAGTDDGRGRAGKWTDAQSGDHGDLLDIIAASIAARRMADTLDEARAFLRMPPVPPVDQMPRPASTRPDSGTPEAARRLFNASKPIAGSVVETYLRNRALTGIRALEPLRFHRRCWYRPSGDDASDTRDAWPAMIAAITDLDGTITGVHRTWLDGAAAVKAPVSYPRRSMGQLLGNGVRFGPADDVMGFGEGLETMLSLRQALSPMSMIAGTSAAHLAAIAFPPALKRLYVARDDDPAGAQAVKTLAERAEGFGIELVSLEPEIDDFNADLQRIGLDRIRRNLRGQLHAEDVARFLQAAA